MKNAIFNEPRFQQTVSRRYYGSLEVIFGFIYQLTSDSSSILEIVACYKQSIEILFSIPIQHFQVQDFNISTVVSCMQPKRTLTKSGYETKQTGFVAKIF